MGIRNVYDDICVDAYRWEEYFMQEAAVLAISPVLSPRETTVWRKREKQRSLRVYVPDRC